MAADAISNTFVREGLLDQLQVTLDETESLYKASNRLALANDMQEMVSAVLSGIRAAEINRAVLLLFEYDSYGKINQIDVGANWYSGRGTPPPPVGTDYPRQKYERFFQTTTPVFIEDILEVRSIRKSRKYCITRISARWQYFRCGPASARLARCCCSPNKQTPLLPAAKRAPTHLWWTRWPFRSKTSACSSRPRYRCLKPNCLYNVSNRIAQATDGGGYARPWSSITSSPQAQIGHR